MKTMILAAVAALSLASTAAFANEGGPEANTLFTEIPGVIAQAPVQQQVPSAYAANHQAGAATGAYVTNDSSGTWVFPPNPYAGGGANN